LSCAYYTGVSHALKGARRAVDRAAEFGQDAADAYARGYDDQTTADLLSCAYYTGVSHARKGARRAVDRAAKFGQDVADAYARGYDDQTAGRTR
jgi:hypothetical protein